jgi:GAF domain-containing protein
MMHPDTSQSTSLMLQLGDVIAAIGKATSVADLFDIGCSLARRFAPKSCCNLWANDPSNHCVYRAHADVPTNGDHQELLGVAYSNDSDYQLLFKDWGANAFWIAAGETDYPICRASKGVACLRMSTFDGIELAFTACVPLGVDGDFSDVAIALETVGQAFANQIRTIRVQRERNLLARISQLSGMEASPPEFYKALAELLRHEFNATGCSIFTYERFRDVLAFAGTTHGLFDSRTNRSFNSVELSNITYDRRTGITGWIFSNNEIVRFNDADDKDEFERFNASHPSKPILEPYRLTSDLPVTSPRPFLGAPISVDDECVGVIRLHGRHKPALFLPSDECILRAAASYIGRAIEQWSAVKRIRRADEREHDLLGTVRDRLQHDKRVKQFLGLIAKQTRMLFHGTSAQILLVDGKELEVIAHDSDRERYRGPMRLSIATGICGRAVRERRLIVSESRGDDPNFETIDPTREDLLQGILSEACCPIVVDDHLLGVLKIDSTKQGAFRDDDVQVGTLSWLEKMASIVAHVLWGCQFPNRSGVPWLNQRALIHKLQDDLGAISGLADGVGDENLSADVRRENAAKVKRVCQARYLYWQTISELRAFNDSQQQIVSLQHVFNSVEAFNADAAANGEIRFKFADDAKAVNICVDVVQILLIAANLISNALRNSTRLPHIDVVASVTEREAILSVTNYCDPIDSLVLAMIGENVTTSRRGFRIGAVLSKQLAELNGGHIAKSSTDRGTVFALQLPIHSSADRSA